MKTALLLASCCLFLTSLQAAWYWPFGTNDEDAVHIRLSELMEPATTNIDAAADFAAEGKYHEAQDSYRAAIAALEKIERENPERASTPEFATVRNKRAYVNAALDSILLAEARENAKAVAVTDTTALEVKMARKPWIEFLSNYVALTNADRLVSRRLAFLASPEGRALLDAVDDKAGGAICASNRLGLAKCRPQLETRRAELTKAYREARGAVSRLDKFSETAKSAGAIRVFDVCRADARKSIAACTATWPKFGRELDRMNRHLESLYGMLMEQGTRKELIDEAWGGGEPEVPTEEDDRGLVKDDGDKRPEVTSQIDSYMEKERVHTREINRLADQARADKKAKKAVQKEVKELLEKDPKSRKARLLMVGEYLRSGDVAAAKAGVRELLDEKPNDGPALNMRAAIEASEGDLKRAEGTLDQAIQSNPRDYHAYYNMASVYLQKGNVDGARRYYETGRSFNGPKCAELERVFKK